jgi:tRNA U34 2-thiouridine synthase MnmA/TrmU
MGHYAKKVTYEGVEYLAKPFDHNKDQTYFLCQLNEEQISSCLFPMEKHHEAGSPQNRCRTRLK